MNMKIKQLSENEFEGAVQHTRLKEKARAMAKSALVDGRQQVAVATEFGVTIQYVNLVVERVKMAYLEHSAGGRALVSVELKLPENLAISLGQFSEVYCRARSKRKCDSAVAALVCAVRRARCALG